MAQSGSCNIARAEENPSGENFVLNLDYFVRQGLINRQNFYNDLYSTSYDKGWLGYYSNLKKIN
jgi:hypothetical protein